MLICSEDLVRFKILADRLMTTCATLKEIEKFLAWIHRFRDTRIFVHAKFDKCFERIKEVVASGKTWVHFDIPWKNEYILEHDNLFGGNTFYRFKQSATYKQ